MKSVIFLLNTARCWIVLSFLEIEGESVNVAHDCHDDFWVSFFQVIEDLHVMVGGDAVVVRVGVEVDERSFRAGCGDDL